MILIIDGTGPDTEMDYKAAMANSFCTQINNAVPDSQYWRGPTLLGREVSQIASNVAMSATSGLKGKSEPVILVGYSRGGCAAIIAARRLKEQGVKVDSLFLFDAVDMQTSDLHLSQIITDNVSFVAHARSAHSFGFWAQNPIASRWYFVNTGRWLNGDGVYRRHSFTGTHGAVGGCPWGEVHGDSDCSKSVAQWMSAQFVERGIPIQLKG